eukprot:gene43663-48677_t
MAPCRWLGPGSVAEVSAQLRDSLGMRLHLVNHVR